MRPGCDDPPASGCGCNFDDGDCIHWEGDGSPENPAVPVPTLDSDPDNLLVCGVGGLLAKLPDLIANPPRMQIIRKLSVQPIPGGNTPTFIEFDTALYDVGGWWSASPDPGKGIVPFDGLYELNFMLSFANTGSGSFPVDLEVRGHLLRNETDIIVLDVKDQPNPATGSRLGRPREFELDAGDSLTLQAWNGGGTSSDFLNTGDLGYSNWISARYIGPKAS